MKILYSLLLFSIFGNEWFSDHLGIDVFQAQAYKLLETNPEKAMDIADSSLALSKNDHYEWGEANAYFIKAYLYDEQNELNKAFYMYLKAANILHGKTDEKSIKTYTEVLINSGAILRKFYKFDEALTFYNRGLELVGLVPQLKTKLILLYNKAYCLRRKGDTPIEAVNILKEALDLSVELNEKGWQIKCWNILGLIHKDQKDYLAAKDYFTLILRSGFSSKNDRVQALHNFGVAFKEEGHLDSARMYFDQALAIKKELNSPKLLYNTLYELADLSFTERNFRQAEIFAIQAEELNASLLLHPESYQIFHLLNLIYLKKADIAKSEFYAGYFFQQNQEFILSQQEIISRYRQSQIDFIQAGFTLEQKAEAQQAKYNRDFMILVLLVLVISLLGYIREKRRRKHLASELKQMLENV